MLTNLVAKAKLPTMLALAVAGGGKASAQSAAPAALPALVSVDFAASRGPVLRAERINSLAPADRWAPQRAADVRLFNQQGLHGSICRVEIALSDPASGGFDPARYAAYLDDASALSDALLVTLDIGAIVRARMSVEDATVVATEAIRALKQRWPRIRYIEAFNEPDRALADVLGPGDLYWQYVPLYRAVNAVNREMRPQVPVEVGGPALRTYDEARLRAFLDGYRADPSPNKRIDFISYHALGPASPGSPAVANPSEVARLRPRLEAELIGRGIDPRIPSFITEVGLYPDQALDNAANRRADYLRQAAGMASLLYWFVDNPRNVPFNAAVRHATQERSDQLVTRTATGQVVPRGVFTPYGNALLMMAKLKKQRVAAESSGLARGNGVYAFATRDESGAAVMLWNYQHAGVQPYRVTLALRGLPPELRVKRVRRQIYRIDDRASNYWADPRTAGLQLVADETVKASTRPARPSTIDLPPNALHLVVIEPTGRKRRR